MYYFVDMYNDKLNFIENISDETCKNVLDASNSVREVLIFYNLGKCVSDAWNELIQWSNEADRSGNHIMRNSHTAERLVRGFLFEFRTCLDHMETEIKRVYGKDSELWNIFKDGISNAYDKHLEYAFTYHLRNYSQHCKNVVHGFNGATGIGISSNVQILLTEYDKWKQVDKNFMSASGSEIDLIKTFSETFMTFNSALAPVIQYLLNLNSVGDKLLYLRRWGDSLYTQFQHDVYCYHIVNILLRNGNDATREDMATEDVVLNAYPIDWEMIYELSNSITTLTPNDMF